MKYRNIIALCLGTFFAALLWQYYLWPKYQIKTGNPDVMAMLDEAAQKELEESIDSSEPGDILFVGDQVNGIDEDKPLLIGQTEDVIFYSQANKPRDILDTISNEEIKKHTGIHLDKKNFIVPPDVVKREQKNLNTQAPTEKEIAEEMQTEEIQNDTSRITMIKLPEEFIIIKDKDSYDKFLQEHEGNYPKVDFTKQIFLAVVALGNMADNFFEIIQIDNNDEVTQVFYRVNLMSVNDNRALNNYKVIDTPNSDIKFIQVK